MYVLFNAIVSLLNMLNMFKKSLKSKFRVKKIKLKIKMVQSHKHSPISPKDISTNMNILTLKSQKYEHTYPYTSKYKEQNHPFTHYK